ncbi:uncharacterized protein [Paramisgurnus dabryanus]|uniref:uncharacterized protein isoform X2 n=1 Tax=Paramisgurnus dabryanus TaxID=90735 RepID=UPI0031F479B8
MDRLIVFCFVLIMDGVFGANFTVSVMKGDDVTLSINAGEIEGNEMLQWKFENKDIALFDLEVKTDPPEYPDKRFTDRLNLDPQTGSLTINNIRTEDSGEYQLKIRGIRDKDFKTLKTFSVTVTEVESVSVMEGGSVYLDTKTKTQAYDVIEVKFKNTLIAKLDRRISPIPDPVLDEGFKGRLHVDLFGSLIITQITTEDSGTYDVHITNSNRIIHKRFTLTVTAIESTSRSRWETAGPVLVSLLVITVIGLLSYIIYIKKRAWKNEMNGL